MKKVKTSPQDDNLTDVLKLLTKKIEEVAVDVHSMKGRMGIIELKLNTVDTNTKVIKSDVEKLRGEMGELRNETAEAIEKLEKKIQASEKRIINEVGEFIADRILPQFDDKADKKDVERLEGKLDRLLHAN